MANLKPYNGPPKLLVAFDIGATYSGVSYCILTQGQVPEILGVTRFPAQRDAYQVPSVLFYDKGGEVRAAGAEVLSEDVIEQALEDGWSKAEWWKLYLRPEHLASSIDLSDLPPLPPGKSAADVFTDFVKYLYQCAKTYIQERHLAFTWSTIEDSIEYILTHPNGWDSVRQQYIRAIVHAGLVPSTPEGRSHVHMLTDGEAALRFCVENLVNLKDATRGISQGVAIIDAGGAAIGLSMFSLALDPISYKEMSPAECRLQGSVFVTRRAAALLRRKLDGWEQLGDDDIAQFTRDFDQATKLIIKSDQEPAYLKVAGRRVNNVNHSISRGRLKFSGEEATGLFSDSIDTTISAFEQQLASAEVPVTMVFLTGGLSTNDWVWSQLQSYFSAKNITIFRPDDHLNKVVAHGAILSVLCPATPAGRPSPSIVCVLPIQSDDKQRIYRKDQWEIDPKGDYFAQGYFESHLHQMVFRESSSLTRSSPEDFGIYTMRIRYYRGRDWNMPGVNPKKSSFSTFCSVRADLGEAVDDLVVTRTALGEVSYQLDFDVIILFGLAVLQAQVAWKTKGGERRIPATVLYD